MSKPKGGWYTSAILGSLVPPGKDQPAANCRSPYMANEQYSGKEIARLSTRMLIRNCFLVTLLLVAEAYILFHVYSRMEKPCWDGEDSRHSTFSQAGFFGLRSIMNQQPSEEDRSLLAAQGQDSIEEGTGEEHLSSMAQMADNLAAYKLTIEDLKAKVEELLTEIEDLKTKSDEMPHSLNSEHMYGRLRDRPEVQVAIQVQIGKQGEEPNKWRYRLLPAEHPSLWQQHTFKPHGTYGFIQFSGYRADAHMFTAPGILSNRFPKEERMLDGCRWVGDDGQVQEGALELHLGSESFDQQYEAGVLVCNLTETTSAAGGHVIAKLDNEEFVMYREDAIEEDEYLKPQEPFKYELAYCSPMLHDAMLARQVWEWIEFHRVLHNVSFFYLYNAGGIDDSLNEVLAPYVEAEVATITDMREVLLFTVVSWGQKLAIADCIQRNRYTAKWVFMGDLDEYIHVKPPDTVQSILAKYPEKGWLSHGAYDWDTSRCTKPVSDKDQFMVERILLRTSKLHCLDKDQEDANLCYSGYGHRKYFLNPRKSIISNVHDILPTPSDGHFFYGNNELWHDHYRGLSTHYGSEKFCSEPVGAPPEGWVIDKETLAVVPLIKLCPLNATTPSCIERVYYLRKRNWEAQEKAQEPPSTRRRLR